MTKYDETQVNRHGNVLVVFTREPEEGRTKTRLMPYFSPAQCAELHRCMLRDISREIRQVDADVVVAYTCGDGFEDAAKPEFLQSIMGGRALFIKQRGEDLGSRMLNAIEDVLSLGYEKAVLIGADIPEIESKAINSALSLLSDCDVALGPTADGGYYLIGMKAVHPEAFDVKSYGADSALEETKRSLLNAGLTVEDTDTYSDIDTPDDISGFRSRMRRSARLRISDTGRFLAENARISVIVPVYNELAEIGNMIRQLTPYTNECEIIIVDGGSTDGSVDLICEDMSLCIDGIFKVITTEKSRATQMNAGARASSGDILFFLHCDSILPERFTEEIRRVMKKNDWGCFKLGFPSRNFFMLTNRMISNFRASRRNLPFGDQGIFIDRELFFEAGMFPEMPLMEDYEFSLRMRRREGIKGPGITGSVLISSDRRYGCGTASILRTEVQMWKLRYMYRRGASAEILHNMYDDVR